MPFSNRLIKFLRISNLLQARQFRYVVVGVWNAMFGYGVVVWLYLWLSTDMHIVWIGVIANILAITMSFMTHKIFVFRSREYWLYEYLRSYVVYGSVSLIGILILWLLVDGLSVNIWIAQGVAIILTVIVSYIGHSRYTFKVKVGRAV